MKEATDYCFQKLEAMDKARLDGDYHQVLRQPPLKALKIPDCHCHDFKAGSSPSIGLVFSAGGEDLQGRRGQNRAGSGRHSHLPAEDVEHFKRGAGLPAILQ